MLTARESRGTGPRSVDPNAPVHPPADDAGSALCECAALTAGPPPLSLLHVEPATQLLWVGDSLTEFGDNATQPG